MDPSDFLATAEDLLALPTAREADLRSAVSRAYYAVYHRISKAVIADIDLQLRQETGLGNRHRVPHDPLVSKLKNCGDSTVEEIGIGMAALLGERLTSDYRLDQTVRAPHAKGVVSDAKVLLKKVDDLGPPRIAAALEAYLRGLRPAQGV
jgi:uncharacterized protein (UPF0332 family)